LGHDTIAHQLLFEAPLLGPILVHEEPAAVPESDGPGGGEKSAGRLHYAPAIVT
jgi:hypothetical protein